MLILTSFLETRNMKPDALFAGSLSAFSRLISPLPLILVLLIPPSLSHGQPGSFHEAGEINRSEFLTVSSDQEATSLFRQTFGKALGLNSGLRTKRGQAGRSQDLSLEMMNEITLFMAQVIISIQANTIQKTLQTDGLHSLAELSNSKTPQAQWLTAIAHSNALNNFLDLTSSVVKLSQEMASSPNQPPSEFSTFASYFDQRYPELINGQDSWISLLETKGAEAIVNRFGEYWEKPANFSSAPEKAQGIPTGQHQTYVHYYVKTRLLSVFTSHLIAKSIRLQAMADYQAGQSWIRLIKWNEPNQKIRALGRLCGQWQWTVHNHQNHQDHKMTLSFSPSSQQNAGQPHPDVIIMNGDTIYLKWTFPSGYQEDSLLLSNRDQRLEGTFKNSGGPHGNISGKRLSNCSR